MSTRWAGMLFIAGGLTLLGGALALFFEGYAVLAGKQTISSITHDAIQAHQWVAALAFGLFMLLVGALVAHFFGWNTYVTKAASAVFTLIRRQP